MYILLVYERELSKNNYLKNTIQNLKKTYNFSSKRHFTLIQIVYGPFNVTVFLLSSILVLFEVFVSHQELL